MAGVGQIGGRSAGWRQFSGHICPSMRKLLTNIFLNSLAPYERRVIELLRNSKDKRARKLAKKRVCFTPSISNPVDTSLTVLPSSELSAAPRRRSTSSSASSPSPAVPVTKWRRLAYGCEKGLPGSDFGMGSARFMDVSGTVDITRDFGGILRLCLQQRMLHRDSLEMGRG